MSDPIKKSNETSAEANKALREAAQQRRAQQQEQAAQQRRAAQQQGASVNVQPESAAETARKNAQMRASAAQRRQSNTAPLNAQQSATAQPAAPASRPYSAAFDRDEAPIRQRRDGQTGCLGGVIYFAFVLSVSIILACVGWLAASDVLALNKDPVEATVTLEKDAFTEEQVLVDNDDGTTSQQTIRTVDLDYVAKSLKS